MLYFNLLSSDTEGTDSKYNMFFSKLNSHSDSKFLKTYTPHVSVVLLLLMYNCCYSYCYQCLVKSTANLELINFHDFDHLQHSSLGPLKSKQGVELIKKKLVFNFRENETKHSFCYGHTKIMLLALIYEVHPFQKNYYPQVLLCVEFCQFCSSGET